MGRQKTRKTIIIMRTRKWIRECYCCSSSWSWSRHGQWRCWYVRVVCVMYVVCIRCGRSGLVDLQTCELVDWWIWVDKQVWLDRERIWMRMGRGDASCLRSSTFVQKGWSRRRGRMNSSIFTGSPWLPRSELSLCSCAVKGFPMYSVPAVPIKPDLPAPPQRQERQERQEATTCQALN